MGYICTRCGGTNVVCEAIVNPNTGKIIDYLDESFMHAICSNCENEVIRDYNRCFKDESLDKDLFMGKYGKVMGEHYYNKFVHEFNGNILKMIGYFRGSEKEGQVFCDMITERIEKYEKRMSYDKGKLNN